MIDKQMTRKEFLGCVGAFVGVLILSRLPFQGTAKQVLRGSQDSYGNATYGRTKKK